ncbi:aldo/keto reductase [Clostridium magnum]|uniref:General stress protein 69 n=1 Tax=Clostridium magnum DSM 2767 TaxID=1121326 RepID=A0A162UN60_9CLOT|nr:aldo/keto reductase [Clostridium magnum]KZL94100.1 general stress protein 69 [Clostridium magnum DSM 2767]SHH95022.1 Predicted oxidoreductase [Clostridium magnum DSM 2767]
MKQLILGTVQLGLDYGINNKKGKPSSEKAFDILNTAHDNGINLVDTASAYGDSEKIIGNFIKDTKKNFKISTKIPKLNFDKDILEQVKISFENSINNLKVSVIEYYLFHNFNDLVLKPETIDYLCKLKSEGVINNIGVSIYDVPELELILKEYKDLINFIQIPFNIFDQRWIKGNLLENAKEAGIEIGARSVYLQGLFFADKRKMDKIHSKTFYYVSKLNELCKLKNISKEEALFSYVKEQLFIDYILIGCENKEQLEQNIKIFNKEVKFTNIERECICNNFSDIEKDIIDPRRWKY